MRMSEIKAFCQVWYFNKDKFGKDRKPPCRYGYREKIGEVSVVICGLKELCRVACMRDYLKSTKRRKEVWL